jgi:hypothetical protein
MADSDSDSSAEPRPAIFDAIYAFDVEALRRELAAGADPNLVNPLSEFSLLNYAVCWRSAYLEQIRERLECISVLLEAGASVDLVTGGRTPLFWIAGNEFASYHAVIAMLLEAGADPNFTYTPQGVTSTHYHRSVLARAAEHGTAATVKKLISAGAVDLDGALRAAIENGKHRNCAPLLRAGAAIPARYTAPGPGYEPPGYSETCAYMMKISAAGGYKAYEKAHRQRLTAIFLAKFPALPVEMLGRILEFTWDIGGH